MKKQFFYGVCALTLALTACSEDWGNSGNEGGAGYIVPSVEVDNRTISSRAVETRAEVTVNDLTLTLTKEKDGKVVWEGKADSFPTDKGFAVGSYLLEAKYGKAEDEGFDKLSLYGSQTVTVADGKTSSISLKACPSNSQVKLEYTDAFQKYMDDWSAKINTVEYVKGETRPACVAPGEVSVLLNIKKPSGVTAQLSLDKIDAKPQYSYTITIDVNNGEVGEEELKITFDELLSQEEITIDLSDKLLCSPAPVIDPDGFISGEAITVISGLSESKELSMSIIAQAGIKEVTLKAVSAAWDKEGINLLNADASKQAELNNLGLEVLGLWKNPGEMAYLNFSKVPEHINYIADGNNENTFEVTVKDKLMRESDPVILKLNIEAINMGLSLEDYYNPGTPLVVAFEFNGSKENIEAGLVTFQYYQKNAARWRDVEIDKDSQITEVDGKYLVTLIIPESQKTDVKIQAVCGGVTSNELTVPLVKYEVAEVDDRNVFATFAYVTLEPMAGIDLSKAHPKFLVSQDGQTYSECEYEKIDGYYKILGLTPSANYSIKINEVVKTFKTEDRTDLLNGNFENLNGKQYEVKEIPQGGKWNIGLGVGYQNTVTYTVNEPLYWYTNNEITMVAYNNQSNKKTWNTWFMQPSVFNSNLIYNSLHVGYLSGTGRDTETPSSFTGFPKTEDNSMVVRNVAWDPQGIDDLGNYSVGFYNRNHDDHYNRDVPTISKKTVGVMYFDSSKISESGFNFNSRPIGLKGKYAYYLDKDNHDDNGIIEVELFKGNNSIKKISFNELTPISEFSDFQFDWKYDFNTAKVDRIVVTIKSSRFEDDNFKVATYNSPHESYQHGATLVVDDFELVY